MCLSIGLAYTNDSVKDSAVAVENKDQMDQALKDLTVKTVLQNSIKMTSKNNLIRVALMFFCCKRRWFLYNGFLGDDDDDDVYAAAAYLGDIALTEDELELFGGSIANSVDPKSPPSKTKPPPSPPPLPPLRRPRDDRRRQRRRRRRKQRRLSAAAAAEATDNGRRHGVTLLQGAVEHRPSKRGLNRRLQPAEQSQHKRCAPLSVRPVFYTIYSSVASPFNNLIPNHFIDST